MDPKAFSEYKPKRPENPKGKLRLCDFAENRLAARTGGKKVPGSGSGTVAARSLKPIKKVGNKGDVIDDVILWEDKATEKQSISLKKSYLIKVTREAEQRIPPRVPALAVSFPVMPEGVDTDWATVPLWFLLDLMEKAGLKAQEPDFTGEV